MLQTTEVKPSLQNDSPSHAFKKHKNGPAHSNKQAVERNFDWLFVKIAIQLNVHTFIGKKSWVCHAMGSANIQIISKGYHVCTFRIREETTDPAIQKWNNHV